MSIRRVKLSNVADNVNTNALGVPDRNHPKWQFSEPFYATRMRVTKVTFPVSFYTAIRKADTTSTFFTIGADSVVVNLQPCGFRTMTDALAVLTFRFNEALAQFPAPNDINRAAIIYDEIIDRMVMRITDNATPTAGPASTFPITLTVGNVDLADILGVEVNTVLTFSQAPAPAPPAILDLVSYQIGGGPVVPITPVDVTDSSDDYFPFPFSPSIFGPTHIFLRSNILNGYTSGGYATGSGVSQSGNILAAVELTTPFNSVQNQSVYDSCLLEFQGRKQQVHQLDLYFTSEQSRRSTTLDEAILDFNNQRWSVELEFLL